MVRSHAKGDRFTSANIVRSWLDDWNMVIVVPQAGYCRIDRKSHAIDLPEWPRLRASVPRVKTEILAGIQPLGRVDFARLRNVNRSDLDIGRLAFIPGAICDFNIVRYRIHIGLDKKIITGVPGFQRIDEPLPQVVGRGIAWMSSTIGFEAQERALNFMDRGPSLYVTELKYSSCRGFPARICPRSTTPKS